MEAKESQMGGDVWLHSVSPLQVEIVFARNVCFTQAVTHVRWCSSCGPVHWCSRNKHFLLLLHVVQPKETQTLRSTLYSSVACSTGVHALILILQQ